MTPNLSLIGGIGSVTTVPGLPYNDEWPLLS